MQDRISMCTRFFYLGLGLMLLAGILSATVWSAKGGAPAVLALVGACLAGAARLCHAILQGAARREGRQREATAPACSLPAGRSESRRRFFS